MVIAKQDITIFRIVEVEDITRYYTLTEDWPDKPTTNPPSSEWSETEPDTSFMRSTSGEGAIRLDDVSPYVHTMDVKVRSKNLISYPYADTTVTRNGVTFTVNADGSVSLSGSSTGQANFYFRYKDANLKKGTAYTLSASGDYSFGGSATLYIYDSVQGQAAYIPLATAKATTFTPDKDVENTYLYLVVPTDRTVSGTIKVQLELGSTATEYKPYVVCGYNENLFDKSAVVIYYNATDLTQTENGFTFKNMNTKSTSEVNVPVFLSEGTYYISGEIELSDGLMGGWALYDIESKAYIINNSSAGAINHKFEITESKTYDIRFFCNYNSEPGTTATYSKIKLERGSIATRYSPISVQQCGRNLYPVSSYKLLTQDNSYYSLVRIYDAAILNIFQSLLGQTITVSYDIDLEIFLARPEVIVRYTDSTYTSHSNKSGCRLATGKTINYIECRARSDSADANGLAPTISNIQFEIGTVATEYEPYVGPVTYTALKDGIVPEVASVSPTTTVYTDTEGVIIDAEYAKDTSECLYFTDLTTYTDDTYKYSAVSKSSDYESAKEAFNKALISENAAQDAMDATDDLNISLHETITEYETAINKNVDSISMSVSKLQTTVSENKDDADKKISELQTKVDMVITEDQVNIRIDEKLQNGVSNVETSTGFTFDEDGLNISNSDSKTNTQITEDGMYVNNTESGDTMLTANKDGVDAVNLHAKTYLIVGGRSRFENYGAYRTGCFWIGPSSGLTYPIVNPTIAVEELTAQNAELKTTLQSISDELDNVT